MSQIITFLGKGGTGRTTIAIAAAKQLAQQGTRVLFASSDRTPATSLLLGVPLTAEPQAIGANLTAVQLQATTLIDKSWEEVKQLEAKYLRSPTLRNVYGQELALLPGMDAALDFYALREYDAAKIYDVIIYDGTGDLAMLRAVGVPENASWYLRRFRQVFLDSDLGRSISPFVAPVTAAILNTSWSFDDLTDQPTREANNLLQAGKDALADPNRIVAYLVTTPDPLALATAKFLWGSAQQVDLTVAGVLGNRGAIDSTPFSPLPLTVLPEYRDNDWQPLIDALPNLRAVGDAPRPISVDVAARQVKVFLPGFDKKQVKLTQNGPDVTIEVGDQRRNIDLPPQLRGQTVKGAKFQEGYLIISF
ncbi:ArsA family ATPase [Oscillatoria sp. FACHB-1406]|uniref:Get3/ArsA fold putative tail anchor-mediating ATPase NosAFP n=1 Tax=Oscillatoria sp. FACHB-1406 TaxID=2692846 RepID=UPI0016847B10|nr:ArsA family ATPase [Oscillatoria sp. FACHB-1406]MBD2576358.1 ArsA family ATPase [Oscillatoria sp. FACHB-1406]